MPVTSPRPLFCTILAHLQAFQTTNVLPSGASPSSHHANALWTSAPDFRTLIRCKHRLRPTWILCLRKRTAIYIYIYVYVYIYIHISHTHIYMYIYICVFILCTCDFKPCSLLEVSWKLVLGPTRGLRV